MKRLTAIAATLLCMGATALAGGLTTNTNYHIAFDRMMARGASHEIDAAYSNPAGLAWGHEGLQLSFNWQHPNQNRDIETTVGTKALFGADYTHKYKGKASAPFVPALFASYRHDRWSVSAMLGIVGSGGKVTYDEGMPMFNVPLMATIYKNTNYTVTPDMYTIDSQVEGKQFIYGAQLNFAWRFTDWLAAAVGLRANYYDGYYRGHVKATMNAVDMTLADMQLDCDQRGWGFNPIISVDYYKNGLTLAARYEFRTKLNIPNKTHVNTIPSPLGDGFNDGVKTRYDMPALLTVAAGYEFTPRLRATLEYHFFDDKNAKMSGNRQEQLTRGTNEVLAGVEYDINDMFTVSCGGQRTDYGLSDEFQSNTSFACDSWSVGLGGAVNLTSKLRVNVGYFWTMYSAYKVHPPAGNPGYCSTTLEGTDTYSRTNRVFGLGVDYKF